MLGRSTFHRELVKLAPLNEAMQNQFDSLLSTWILSTANPFSTVTESTFVDFVHALNSRYKLPNRRLLKQKV
jgi:hypothetical protein